MSPGRENWECGAGLSMFVDTWGGVVQAHVGLLTPVASCDTGLYMVC